jgi:large subunit ribosomal protein L3
MKDEAQLKTPKAMLGQKLGMTQIWDANGHFIPVTVIEVSPNVVTQVIKKDDNGYNAVQFAYGSVNPQKVTAALKGHFEKAGVTPRRYITEVATDEVDEYNLADEVKCDIFEVGSFVDITGATKGKGFQGTMKRHGFHGVGASHGAHRNHRKPGSIGQASTPSRVRKGLKMSGRMGAIKHTVQNVRVFASDATKNVLIVKGAVPGPKNGIVLIKSAVKMQDVKAGK